MAGWMVAIRGKRPVKKTRAQCRAERSPSYRWWRHALALAAISVAVIAVSISQLHRVAAWQWLCFGGFLIFTNFAEYWLHRIPFHNPLIPDFTYYAHTVGHHGFFSYKRMQVDEMNDLRFVMFEVWVELLTIGTAALISLPIYFYAGHNLAWLYMLAVMSYYSIYEATHALSHLPEDNPVGAMRLVKALGYHHRVHHDPRLMRKYNFNFAIPLFDWMFGTTYHPAPVAVPVHAPVSPDPGARETSGAGIAGAI
ncbi:MAG: sterol desaturase family protein [Candidatus Binataceae bacterium]